MKPLTAFFVLPSLALGAPAAAAQFTVSGSSCAGGSGTVVHISGDGFPTVGQIYSLQVTGPPLAPVVLGYSLAPIPPIDLSPFGFPGCDLQILPLGSIATTIGFSGTGIFQAPPPAVAGITVYAQAFVTDPGPATAGATTELISYTTLPPSGLSGGELITTEFMRDPIHIADQDGEWIEVYNTTASPIDMEGWYLADDGFELHRIDLGGAGLVVPAGGFAVLGAEDDPTISGVALDYEWDFFILSDFLGTPSDEIRLLDPSGFEVDRIVYANPAGWPWGPGASVSLDPGAFDAVANDDPANWCLETTAVYDLALGANTGTPGLANSVCPPPPTEQGDVIVTEIMKNPSALADMWGEWIEVYNTTAGPIDLEGWTVSDFGVNSFTIDVGGAGLILPPGGHMVFATSPAAFTPDYLYIHDVFILSNGDDEVVLTDPSGQLQDVVQYDDGIQWLDAQGQTLSFDPAASQDAATNNDGSMWCGGSTPFGLGDLGTPGAPNDPCP